MRAPIMLRIKPSYCATIYRLLFITVTLGLLCPIIASAAEPVKVMVLPFEVHATEELDYLGTQIADVLSDHLQKEGAEIIGYSGDQYNPPTRMELTAGALETMARQFGVNHIIWGSFTLIGQTFSLDAQMWSQLYATGPMAFNAEGRKLENLLRVLKSLSEEIGHKLFQHETVTEIRVEGNDRIEADAILRQIQTKVGSIYKKDQVTQDLRSIYKMGYFDDLKADAESTDKGKVITFHVKEKPTIRRIKISGNLRFDDEEIKENLTISTGAILNIFKIRSNLEQIENQYKEKNYHQIVVDYKVHPLKNNQADIEFVIKEGPKIYVTTINFEGNKAIETKKLKKVIKTSEKGFFYWITSSGDLDRSKLDQDAALLKAFYGNQGYIRVRVSDPIVDIHDDGIIITFKIDEGSRFKVGKIDVSGDLIQPREALLENLSLGKSTYFSRETLRSDIIALTDLYGNYGYAHADVRPQVHEDNNNLVVDVTYEIQKKQEVYYENIFISGNNRTRDKVIRRQLRVYEKERFNGAALKRSIRNLYRLDYFDDIKVNSLKGSTEDQMVLKIDVTEKPTGAFSFGAGYSSEENLFFTGSISQRNFLGKGQQLTLVGEIGGSTTRYNVSFTEPWLFDIPLSATVFTYDQLKEYTEYTRDSLGGGFAFGYPVYDYTRLYLSYSYDTSDVSDISDDADDTIKELEGTNATSKVGTTLSYDSRDKTFNPTEGSKHSINFDHAGLGGDVGFNKVIVDTGWYFPLFKGLIGFVHGKAGWVDENDDSKILPDYEKFYLGGINSMRGFEYRGIYIPDTNSEGIETKRGGTRMLQFNIEAIFPISEKLGLMGVVFFDAGNVYDDRIDWGDLRQSAGAGFRWYSPLAPIRVEYGKILDRREGEDEGRWEFTMGGAF